MTAPMQNSERENTDVLILNTAVLDLRSREFSFADDLVGPGGLAKCGTADMPGFPQDRIAELISSGCASAGGPGNTAPLIARAGLKVAVGCNLGAGNFGGLDIQGRTFHDILSDNGVDMSATFIHPDLPTGTTFIHEAPGNERGGIAYFPNANDDFDFEYFKDHVRRFNPRIVYYMYSGLSDRGDANEGKDLAAFMAWCREQGCITIVDSHTLTADPQALIRSGEPVASYKLLLPLLPEIDIFFTSADEARMIENTLDRPRQWNDGESAGISRFLSFMIDRFPPRAGRMKSYGVTVSSGAYEAHVTPDGRVHEAEEHESRFMAGEVIDLVGAGDSFRAGLISCIAKNADAFLDGTIDMSEAVQIGNLFASLYIKAPLNDRYGNIRDFDRMLSVVHNMTLHESLDELIRAMEQ